MQKLRLGIGFIVGLLFFAVPTQSQKSSNWIHSTENDALHGKVNEKFVLVGKYLTPPEHARDAVPSLVVICSDGKVKENYLNVGAVVTMEGHSNLVAWRLEWTERRSLSCPRANPRTERRCTSHALTCGTCFGRSK